MEVCICTALITNEHISMSIYMGTIWISSFMKFCVKAFVWFILLACRSPLYVLEKNLLLNICIKNYLFPFSGLPFLSQ